MQQLMVKVKILPPLTELKGERLKAEGERTTELEDELLNDIEQNLEKINHHGKRAEASVKGMLQHSRSSSGKKEPTDINALVDEYLRLRYHGLRAKDKSFTANFKTDLDNSIGNINVIPQKILDKIYQPFFTTKPTGQGTGLGLSMSYDIIKAHGGKIKVETKEGEFTEFVVILPIN